MAGGAVGLFVVVLGGVIAWGRQPDPVGARTTPAPSLVPSPATIPNGSPYIPRRRFRIPGLPNITPQQIPNPQQQQTPPDPRDKGDGFHFVDGSRS